MFQFLELCKEFVTIHFVVSKLDKFLCYIGLNNISSEDRFASILEYLPYGKDTTLTLQRDHSRHTWFCSHGFVDFRVDVRGTGVSQGENFPALKRNEVFPSWSAS